MKIVYEGLDNVSYCEAISCDNAVDCDDISSVGYGKVAIATGIVTLALAGCVSSVQDEVLAQEGPVTDKIFSKGDKVLDYACCSVDIDADGNPDIFSMELGPDKNTFEPFIRYNDGHGNYSESHLIDLNGGRPHALVDLNGDGLLDIVTTKEFTPYDNSVSTDPYSPIPPDWTPPKTEYSISVHFNNGDNTFTEVSDVFQTNGEKTSIVAIADFNNDGIRDFVTSAKEGDHSVTKLHLFDKASNSYAETERLPGNGAVAMVADSNMDGRLDIMTKENGDYLLHPNKNEGTVGIDKLKGKVLKTGNTMTDTGSYITVIPNDSPGAVFTKE